uniref:Reverse transcriptase domain-containing protein n=1 Tax=Neogobius melanostomus TaxID=47308 RepID=A0A8C6V2B9_9GOBI
MQFGFRTNHSTETACCYFMESIKSSLDTGKVVGAVFLDLRKAFDTVNHLVLLSKLKQYNLSINTLSWIKSYLAGRSQCVRVSEAVSPLRECTMGVPQGSILGPLLFSLYINDLPSVCDDVDVQMYADDTVIYTDGKDHEQVATKLSKAMDKISIWLNDSCLTLNVSKTATMFFSTKPNKKTYPLITVKGEKIENVNEFRYLGIFLDSRLSFKKHIKKVCHTIKYNLFTFKSIRNSLTIQGAKTYFNAMILPHLLYGVSCWSQANKSTIKPLESLYKQALRILDRKSRQYHHCQILTKYKMLNFECIVRSANLKLLFKIVNNVAPPPLKRFVQLTSDQMVRTTRSTVNGQCTIPKRKTAFGQSAFSFKTISEWNKLPTALKLCKDLKRFCLGVKQHFLGTQ